MTALGFYILPIIVLFMVLYLLKQAGSKKRALIYFMLGVIIWLIYILSLVESNILMDFTLPPKLPLFIVFPTIVLIMVLTSRKFFEPLLRKTSLQLPIYLQSFRIVVELLIYGAFLKGVLPQQVTFEGFNFDILVGISALLMGFLAQTNRLGTTVLMAWNILALSVLGLTAFSFIHSFYFTDFVEVSSSSGFVKVPYVFLPAILLPTAVFLHIFSIRQILHRKRLTK